MALRAKDPDPADTRFKAEWFGDAGDGKTTAALQFPHAYVIDAEKGSNRYGRLIASQQSKVMGIEQGALDLNEIVNEVNALLTEKHDFETLVIDPFTPIWYAHIERCERKVGSEFGRHIAEGSKLVRRLDGLMQRLDMNVIIVSHQTNEYGPGMVKVGVKADSWNKHKYFFDCILRLSRQDGKHWAHVVKQRVELGCAEALPESFEWQADPKNEKSMYGWISRHFGPQNIGRKAVPVKLASPEEINRINEMVKTLNISEDVLDRWFSKAKVTCFAEMDQKQIESAVAWCNAQLDKLISKKEKANG